MLGGRGAGKTRAGAEWIRAQVEGTTPLSAGTCRHIALVGETLLAVREVMIEGPSGLRTITPSELRPEFIASRGLLIWPNGAQAQVFSARRPDSLRGPQFDAAWCDELAKWQYDRDCWDMLQFGLRLGNRPRQVVTTTPRPTRLIKQLMADPNCHVTRSSTHANRAHLAPGFVEELLRRYDGTRLGRQEIEAELVEDIVGALWTHELIAR
ncbi:MAG: terminase family protein, partial [Alphaproteobacteria bacterium]|nr:terminase family protein [Alphaproteobacteria bacterium]